MSHKEKIENLAKELGLSFSEAEIIINDLEPEPKEKPKEESKEKKLKVKRKKKEEQKHEEQKPVQQPIQSQFQSQYHQEQIIVNNQLSSEDILKIMNISNPNILNIFLKVMYDETIKKEKGEQYCVDIDYCIGLATDKHNDKFKKIEEIKRKIIENDSSNNFSNDSSNQEEEKVTEIITDKEDLRKQRSLFFSQLNSHQS